MIFAKTTPYGLDAAVKIIQENLDADLNWSGTRHVYGLMQENIKDDKKILEAYISGKEYKEIFVDDRIACSIGFIDNGREVWPYTMANIDCVFTVRLDLIKPSAATRENEIVLIEAGNVLKSAISVMQNSMKIKTGIADVFSKFNIDMIKYRDMHPWFVFSFNFDIHYSEDICQ